MTMNPYSTTPKPAPPYPVFLRAANGRVVGGVAAGLANHLRIDVLTVRLVLLLSSLLGGFGVLFYAAVWIFTKQGVLPEVEIEKTNLPKLSRGAYLGLAAIGVLGAIVSVSIATGFEGATILPFIIVGLGALVVWRAYDEGLESLLKWRSAVSVIAGMTLVMVGLLFVSLNWESPETFGAMLVAILFTLLGVGILTVPLGMRMWEELAKERDEKAAAAERAEIASRLHDSVLQTLALIQKRADDKEEVAKLARKQERELRQWLFNSDANMSGGAATAFDAIKLACGEVEDMYGLRIVPVIVGSDVPLEEQTQAAVMAAREAMVNVAKHAQVQTADVYAECFGETLDIFVRDRGVGFDPENIPDGHHGLVESIHARIERAGGTTAVKSKLGEGAEVHISVPLAD